MNSGKGIRSTAFWSGVKTTYSEQDRQRDHRLVHLLSIISMPVGLLFFGMHGAVFAILLNRPLWNGAMTPFLFIMAALLSGGALITFLTYLFHPRDELVQPLGRVVLGLLATFLFLEALQFFVGYQSKVPNFVTSLNLIAFGPFWWAFWILHLLIGSAIPMYILITPASRHQGGGLGLLLDFDHVFRGTSELPDPRPGGLQAGRFAEHLFLPPVANGLCAQHQ